MAINRNKTVVLGVVYPGVENYLEEYFKSLSNQSYMNYDLCIYNDGLDEKLLEKYINKYYQLLVTVKTIDDNYTPAQIRELAIHEIKNKYDYLIFTDADDYISLNRIEESINILQNYDFCYNDMILVDNKGKKINDLTYFKNRNNPIIVNNYYEILNKNFCGLTNTAINLKRVNLDFIKIPSEIIAVDWWIFSLLLIRGYVGHFVEEAITYYRQHEINTVGGLSILTEKQLMIGLKVKKIQYKSFLAYYPSKFDSIIKEEFDNILLFENKMKEKTQLQRYIDNINNESRDYMWWENIKLEERWIIE